MIDFLRFKVWPSVKVKATYWFWVVKYGGKDKIPPELLLGQMGKSIARMKEALAQAMRLLPEDSSDEEKRDLLMALSQAEELERIHKNIKSKK